MKPHEGRLRILLVDDSRAVLDAGRARLTAAGFEVVTHPRGFGAMALVRSEQPDLLLVDIASPVLQGAQLCKEVKGDPSMSSVRVLLHSSLDDDDLSERARECGADGFVSKFWEWDKRIACLPGTPAPLSGWAPVVDPISMSSRISSASVAPEPPWG